MIDLEAAAKLLDFGARIGEGQRADEQLEGAVALHNLLDRQGVAYLADEVGMGKTYVALGALAIFRHFDPAFRVLVIAPRENIQMKWMKELRNFVAHNVRFADLRVKAIDEQPVRPLLACRNLLELVHEVLLNRDRDFFLRLSSFSLPVAGRDRVDPEAARRLRDGLRHYLPWLADDVFDLRTKQAFKDNIACAVCCALPPFDLVIVDEAHNLKHGFSEDVSARNRVLALAFGRLAGEVNSRLFPNYGLRAKRVLLLSATPVEETYRQLWNQLDVFRLAEPFTDLCRSDLEEDTKKDVAARFLLRRVTSIRIGGSEHTKNLYRREWRRGGVYVHDEPIQVTDPRQRLIVALVQKKVSELLGHERFNSSFQIGMLASFESFLETTRVKREDDETGNFDDAEQAVDDLEREGIDVGDVNRLARSYRQRFDAEMPHPKMDALVDALSKSWHTGTKTLVFVRRVASVKELKRKLDEQYDKWLLDRLHRELPEQVQPRLARVEAQYREERQQAAASRAAASTPRADGSGDADRDQGGTDTFFAWFFRGEGPRGIVSGANIQQRFIQRGATYATFFEDNYVAEILGCEPGVVERHLASALGVDQTTLRAGLRERSARFLSRVQKHARADRFEAVQAAAIQWLKDHSGPHQDAARIVWHQRFESSLRMASAPTAPEIGDWLELRTFFTELRLRPELRQRLWPRPTEADPLRDFREKELRGQLLAAAARLGHAFIDLYIMTIQRLGSLDLRAQEQSDVDRGDAEVDRIGEYLDLLERQMRTPRLERGWGAFDELGELAENFNLVLDVNAPDARLQPLSETARLFGQMLRQQQPIGGMSGQVNQTLVRQFRLPGYPLVLISTDLLQEGEDLHTFCSSVHHYGISWTPSAMEQRIGRIDRVRSQTDRRLSNLAGELREEDKLQVYFPHLEDTVEVLQVQRVLERMNIFLRLMHEGLTTAATESGKIQADHEFAGARRVVPQIRERLRSAFPVRDEQLQGGVAALALTQETAQLIRTRFLQIPRQELPGLSIDWEEATTTEGVLLGTARLGHRVQPFQLRLQTLGNRLLIRCVSPVGCVDPTQVQEQLVASASRRSIRIGVAPARQETTYDVAVVDDVLLADDVAQQDVVRVAMLIRRVVERADLLEQEYLPGNDADLGVFRKDLKEEIQDES